ncbi:TonB-dependent receptor [Terracidiphilus gabretensis]|uniref:TonB-dependent receptor n=1 Tax=Terracidiphilus gabretensis TaxID=1577687 RepID=UPI00071B9F36|nr:TonB-dependent receptor [Terracidiphilus gabretensis]
MFRDNLWKFFAILTFALILGRTGWTQSTTGTITGTVTDSSNAVVTHAQLTLTNTLTGLVKATATNGAGQYVFDFVPIGHYSLQAIGNGFNPERRDDIDISAAQGIQINFTFDVASTTQSVSVTSEDPLVSVGTSDMRTNVSATQINELPVAHQDWTTLLQTASGVAQSNNGSAGSEAGSGIVINGLPATGYNLTVDGTNATQDAEHPSFGFSEAPNVINTINNDAIQEVSMVRGIAPATVSGTMAGNINIITKGGSNTFHGDVFELNEVSMYDARNQFEDSRPRTTFNQFGGAISGPIMRNKLFFFGSYTAVKLNAFTDISDDVPTPYLISISPAAYLSTLAFYPKIAQPADDLTAITDRVHANGSTMRNDSNGVARMDYNLSGNDQFTARYTRGRPDYTNPTIISINDRTYMDRGDTYNASWIHSASHWTSNARFGYNRIRTSRVDNGFGSDLEGLKLSPFNTNGAEFSLGMGSVWTAEDGIAWTRGRHTLQFGGILQLLNAGRVDLNTTDFKYSSLSDYQNNLPSSVEITFDLPAFNIYEYQFGGYAQDDYRIRSNLTLNLGIRYDFFTVPREDSGRFFNRGIDPNNPQLGPGFGPYRPANSLYDANYFNFQPRVGFSWGPFRSGKTVVRGGFGIFTNPHQLYGEAINEVQANAYTPFRITLNRQQAIQANLHFPLPRTDYSTVLQQLQDTGVATSNFANSAVAGHYPNPYSMQYTLGISQAMPWKTSLDIAYVGNRGLHENITAVENLPDRITGIAPVPTFSEFNYYYAGDNSKYNALQVEVKKNLSHGVTLGAAYTWSRNMALEYAGLLKESSPQDNNNVHADWGPTDYDVRNFFVLNGVWEMHWMQLAHMHSHFAQELLGGWQVSGVFKGFTGSPTNIGDGDSSYPNDRVDAAPGVSRYTGSFNISNPQYLNPAAFVAVPISELSGAQIHGGDLGKNVVYEPGSATLDASLTKAFHFTERVQMKLHMDAFNTLNHTNLGSLDTDITSGTFGQLTSATARTMQIGAKVNF